MNATCNPPLTSFRVYFDDGTSMVTSMAAGVTLEQAQRYYVGHSFEITEQKSHRAIRVEPSSYTQEEP